MAPTDDQASGDHENNPRTQPQDDLGNSEDSVNYNSIFTNPSMIQPENDPLDSENNATNILMAQAAVGTDRNTGTSSNYINNFVADGNASGSYASVPRGDVVMEGIQDFFSGNKIAAEEGHEGSETDLNTETPNVTKSKEEWQERQPEIRKFYIDANYTLTKTRERMAERGFYATESAYKRKFAYWGREWKTYVPVDGSENTNGEYLIDKPRKRPRGKASDPPSMLREDNSHPKTSRGTSIPASAYPPSIPYTNSQSAYSNFMHTNNTHYTPSHLYPAQPASVNYGPSALREDTSPSYGSNGTTAVVLTHSRHPRDNFNSSSFHLARSGMGIPAPMSKTKFEELYDIVVGETQNLYISSPEQKKWKAENEREVEEDIHDDLLVGIATSVKNYRSLNPEVGDAGFEKALRMLEKVVGVRDGANCGLFSLPAIWVSFLRIIRGERLDWAQKFLELTLKLAIHKFDLVHPFVQVLLNLREVWRKLPDKLEHVIFAAYRKCIENVKKKHGARNLTYLSLWSDYVVYVDGGSTNDTQAVVNDIREVIKSEEKNKLPGEPDSDYILDLFGLILYVLQSAPKMPDMADQAEKVAEDLFLRVEYRMRQPGEELNENIFITWKDLKHTLGKFCLDRSDYLQGIDHLQWFRWLEIMDERDALALEKLGKCYLGVGRYDDFVEVWQLRLENSQRLLWKTDGESFEREEVVNHNEERDDNDSGNVSEEGGGSEASVVNQVEEMSEESLEEDERDGFTDTDAEIKLVQEQLAVLNQRLNLLKQAKSKGKSIVT